MSYFDYFLKNGTCQELEMKKGIFSLYALNGKEVKRGPSNCLKRQSKQIAKTCSAFRRYIKLTCRVSQLYLSSMHYSLCAKIDQSLPK